MPCRKIRGTVKKTHDAVLVFLTDNNAKTAGMRAAFRL